MRLLFAALLAVPMLAIATPSNMPLCDNSAEPVQAVIGYLTSMQEHRFADAYDFVSDEMTDGRPREEWSSMQEFFYVRGEVDIYSIDPRPAVAPGGNTACEETAIVPNILNSRDKFNYDGIVEFELYTVVRDGLDWRVESQETLYDNTAIYTWFPDVEIVEVSANE